MSRSAWGGGRTSGTRPTSCPPVRPDESAWAALDRRRTGPRRVPVLVLGLLAVAVLIIGVAVGAGAGPVVSHGGVVAVADDDGDDDGGDNGGGDNGGGDNGGDNGGGDNGGDGREDGGGGNEDDDQGGQGGQGGQGDQGGQDGGQGDDEEFPGRDEIGRAAANEYVEIQRVRQGFRGEGGAFSGGSYSIRCAVSDHKNSDNYLITPGKRNGAQHVHDYAGNEGTNFASEREVLEETATTCTNGDRSPIFWPVLRDLRSPGPDVGVDGGSLDGNVGALVEPTAVDFTFHGHGSRRAEALPLNIALVTGSAKAGTNDGEGANAKYTCSGTGGRMTDLYPMCPQGSALQRVYDFPSCWNGQDLDSEDHTTHIVYPDADGECDDDLIPVPALRITVSYENAPPGRQFAIDSFPEQQHNPITDHALLEYLSSERRAEEGVACINAARRCVQGPEQDAASTGSTDAADRVPRSQTFAHAFATHATAHQQRPAVAPPGHGGHGGHGGGREVGAARFPGADRPAMQAPPATLPDPEPSGGPGRLAVADPSWTLGPLPGLTRLPVLAAPLGPASSGT
ncbi:DUF1996 domain-containing protein [Actinomycetospora aeridis]|uniref:DUF1996 domain-containing protein n=1 Tax=Actinomycetospora aeridis TaxID=3129231 RepID=A0ABU8NE39_9PSEU